MSPKLVFPGLLAITDPTILNVLPISQSTSVDILFVGWPKHFKQCKCRNLPVDELLSFKYYHAISVGLESVCLGDHGKTLLCRHSWNDSHLLGMCIILLEDY